MGKGKKVEELFHFLKSRRLGLRAKYDTSPVEAWCVHLIGRPDNCFYSRSLDKAVDRLCDFYEGKSRSFRGIKVKFPWMLLHVDFVDTRPPRSCEDETLLHYFWEEGAIDILAEWSPNTAYKWKLELDEKLIGGKRPKAKAGHPGKALEKIYAQIKGRRIERCDFPVPRNLEVGLVGPKSS